VIVLSVKLSLACPQTRLWRPTRAVVSAVRKFRHQQLKFGYLICLKFQVSVAVVPIVVITPG
jgi:hypothetical protein